MKKFIIPFLVILAVTISSSSKAQVFNFSITPSYVCFNNAWPPSTTNTCLANVTATVGGATSYSWACVSGTAMASVGAANSPIGADAILSFTSCGLYTVTCSAFNGSSPVGVVTSTLDVMCPNWFTAPMPTWSTCIGSQALLTASGGTSYTWTQPGVPFGIPLQISTTNTAVVSTPTVAASINVTVAATNLLGCTAQSVIIVNTNMTSPITAGASSVYVCPGASATLNAGGGSNYTWIPGNISATSTVVYPTSVDCYTVFGLSSQGCIGSAAICLSVVPNVSVTSTASSICAGSGYSLSAMNAMSYTWIPGNFASANITVYPTSPTCFTVIGNNSGCTSTAVACVTVMPTPTLLATGISTVCLGTSATLAASGALTYTWNVGSTTPSITVMPTVSTCYTVMGTDANGCTGSAVSCVAVNNTCSDVWPGDANSDGIVDNTDVFELGLAYSNTGPARSPGGNGYTAQFANNWSGLISTGKNQCHADCNGDGTIDNDDTLAIYNNYSLTHSFKPTGSAAQSDIDIVANPAVATGGAWNKADIIAGSASTSLSQLYGLAYEINFDQSLIQTDSVYLVYTSSFFNAGQNLHFRKTFFMNGKLVTASVRSNGTATNGNGKIGELWFKVKSGLPNNAALNLSVSNSKKINAAGQLSALTGGSTVLTVNNVATGIATASGLNAGVVLYPNPATHQLTLQSSAAGTVYYQVFDITGRKVMESSFTHHKTIELGDYTAGTYLVKLETASGIHYQKLVIEK